MASGFRKSRFLLSIFRSSQLIEHFQHGIHSYCLILVRSVFVVISQKYRLFNFLKRFLFHGSINQLLQINNGFEAVLAIPVTAIFRSKIGVGDAVISLVKAAGNL